MKDYFSKIDLGNTKTSNNSLATMFKQGRGGNMLQNVWTDEEKDLLRQNYKTDIDKLKLMFPNRTKCAIITRISMLKKEDMKTSRIADSLSEVKKIFKTRKVLLNEIHRQTTSLEQLQNGMESINKKLLSFGIEV